MHAIHLILERGSLILWQSFYRNPSESVHLRAQMDMALNAPLARPNGGSYFYPFITMSSLMIRFHWAETKCLSHYLILIEIYYLTCVPPYIYFL